MTSNGTPQGVQTAESRFDRRYSVSVLAVGVSERASNLQEAQEKRWLRQVRIVYRQGIPASLMLISLRYVRHPNRMVRSACDGKRCPSAGSAID